MANAKSLGKSLPRVSDRIICMALRKTLSEGRLCGFRLLIFIFCLLTFNVVPRNFHFERYLWSFTYSLSVACRVGRQLTLYYPPEFTNRQNQTLQKRKRKRKDAPDGDRQVSVPPVSLPMQENTIGPMIGPSSQCWQPMLAANVGYRYWTDDRSRLG